MTEGHPPDEPHLRSEPALLSPASPKPLHFPTPTNIPVLDKMMDVGFNQTETHMADPAMHNTELRPGAWQDPKDGQAQASSGEAGANGTAPAASAAPEPAASFPSEGGQYQASARDAHTNIPAPQNASPEGVSDDSVAQAQASIEPTYSAATDSAAHHADAPNHPTHSGPGQPSATPLNGEVDVQALLQTLHTNSSAQPNPSPAGEGSNVPTAMSPTQTHQHRAPGVDSSPVSLGAPPSGLPPRPPPQEQPLINANYSHSQHIRDYHPHAANPAYQSNNPRGSISGPSSDPASQTFVPPVHVSTEAAPGATPSFNEATPTITQEQQAIYGASVNRMQGTTPLESRREYKIAAGLNLSEDDQPWTADTQRKYDKFIEDERKYVSEGRWEQFPMGSRLFVGNLSSERVTKRDIFHAFHRYGDLAQISIKQAYGFVQFLRPQDCSAALSREEGRQIRGKKIHLEVSKPQRNRNSQPEPRPHQSPVNTRRRSRSPDYGRGSLDRYPGSRMGYNGRDGRDIRDRDRDRERDRDGFRPYRSPSPRSPRGERYRDERYRDRSPSYNRGGRFSRHASPADSDDGLPLPRRAPQNVPDVQIISTENLNRDFINWIEKAFQSRGLTVDVLYLSLRLDFDAVVRRQLKEGVLAVCRLSRANQDTGLINLRLFDRTGAGANNIKFDDYDNQDLQICVELVSRKKQSMWGHQPPQQPYGFTQPAYGLPPAHPTGFPPGYGAPPTHTPSASAPPPAPPVPAGLQQLITSLDPKGLQNLLAAMQQPVGAPQSYAPPQQFNPNQQAAITALQHNPSALAGYIQAQSSQQPRTPSTLSPPQPTSPTNMNGNGSGSRGSVNMQEILARLGTYR